MNYSNDKTQFDVFSHLTDIPLLGKQYVPGLWRQFEGGSSQPVHIVAPEVATVDQRTPSTSSQSQQKEKENTAAQTSELSRPIEKRPSSNAEDLDSQSPPAKVSRMW